MLAYPFSLSLLTMVDLIEKAINIWLVLWYLLARCFTPAHTCLHIRWPLPEPMYSILSSASFCHVPVLVQVYNTTLILFCPFPKAASFAQTLFLVYVFAVIRVHTFLSYFFSISFHTNINLAERQLQHLK